MDNFYLSEVSCTTLSVEHILFYFVLVLKKKLFNVFN